MFKDESCQSPHIVNLNQPLLVFNRNWTRYFISFLTTIFNNQFNVSSFLSLTCSRQRSSPSRAVSPPPATQIHQRFSPVTSSPPPTTQMQKNVPRNCFHSLMFMFSTETRNKTKLRENTKTKKRSAYTHYNRFRIRR